MTRGMVLRAVLKGVGLFILFNLVYGLINPVETGRLPTLYNTVFPGLTRFRRFSDFDPYRMVDNHAISAARADTFNIVMLGSSEMWGAGTLADAAIPARLDQLRLAAADGRPVRVYNLAHPAPYFFRDLILLDVVLQRQIPVDLVILSTFDASLSIQEIWIAVARDNLTLSFDVLDRYNLDPVLLSGWEENDQTPFFLRFWRDRDDLLAWVSSQVQAVTWSLTRIEFSLLDHDEDTTRPGLPALHETMTLDRIEPPASPKFLTVFKRLSEETGIPVIILAAPVPYKENEFAPWLQDQTRAVGLPLMDCWQVFRNPADFEEFVHVQPRLHELYARIIASHLSDAAFVTGEGMSLQLPSGFTRPSESCALYPAS